MEFKVSFHKISHLQRCTWLFMEKIVKTFVLQMMK